MKNPNIEYLEMLKNSKFIFNKKEIKEQLNYLAEDISEKLHNKNPLILTVMNNGLRYSSDLQKKFKFPFRTGYIDYNNISHLKVPSDIITFDNLFILIVDAIIDTGTSLKFLYNKFKTDNNEVYVTTMFDRFSWKPNNSKDTFFNDIGFLGMSICDKNAFGYGMDYKEQWRGLNQVRSIKVEDVN